jgi:hypothetical protein
VRPTQHLHMRVRNQRVALAPGGTSRAQWAASRDGRRGSPPRGSPPRRQVGPVASRPVAAAPGPAARLRGPAAHQRPGPCPAARPTARRPARQVARGRLARPAACRSLRGRRPGACSGAARAHGASAVRYTHPTADKRGLWQDALPMAASSRGASRRQRPELTLRARPGAPGCRSPRGAAARVGPA